MYKFYKQKQQQQQQQQKMSIASPIRHKKKGDEPLPLISSSVAFSTMSRMDPRRLSFLSSSSVSPSHAPHVPSSGASGGPITTPALSPTVPLVTPLPQPPEPITPFVSAHKLKSVTPLVYASGPTVLPEEEKELAFEKIDEAAPVRLPKAVKPGPLRLPSIKRREIEEPTGLDLTVQAQPISDEERARFQSDYLRKNQTFFKAKAKGFAPFHEFEKAYQAAAMKPYNVKLSLASKGFDAPMLSHVFSPTFVGQFTMLDKKAGEDMFKDTVDMLDKAATKFGKDKELLASVPYIDSTTLPSPQQRAEMLGQLAYWLLHSRANNALANYIQIKLKSEIVEKEFNEEEQERIFVNQRLHNSGPDKSAAWLLKNFGSKSKGVGVKLPQNIQESLQQIIDNTEVDKAQRTHGFLNEEEFKKKMATYQEDVTDIVKRLGLASEQREYQLHLNMVDKEDLSIFEQRINRIRDVIKANPNNIVAKKLNKVLDDTLKGLKKGTYDLEEAYAKINGLNVVTTNVIDIQGPKHPVFGHLLNPNAIKQNIVLKEQEAVEAKKGPPAEPSFKNAEGKKELLNPKDPVDLEYATNLLRNKYVWSYPNFQLDIKAFKDTIPVALHGRYVNDDKDRDTIAIGLDSILKADMDSEEKNAGPKSDGHFTLLDIVNDPDNSIRKVNDVKKLGDLMNEIRKNIHGLAKGIQFKPRTVGSFMKHSDKWASTPSIKKIATSHAATGGLDSIEVRQQDIMTLANELWSALNFTDGLIKNKIPPIGKGSANSIKQLLGFPGNKVTSLRRPVAVLKAVDEKTLETRPVYYPVRETQEQERARKKKYSQENFHFQKSISKETPELLKAEYGDKVIEFHIKSESDLQRMKSEVTRMSGQLFIIDLKTGRLFPTEIDKAIINQSYVFIKEVADRVKKLPKGKHYGHAVGGAFAFYPAFHKILNDEQDLLPNVFMRNGNDKAMQMLPRAAGKQYSNDYRDQLRREMGAGLWGHIRKGLENASKSVGNYAIRKTVQATNDLGKASAYEVKNFINREKKNVNYISNANKDLYSNPSFGNLNKAINRTVLGGVRLVAQPALSTARETANLSDWVGKVPGLNVAKSALGFFVPPIAVADAVAKGIRNVDDGRYYDAAINAGDALISSGKLKGAADLGARVLSIGAKVGDRFIDPEAHKAQA